MDDRRVRLRVVSILRDPQGESHSESHVHGGLYRETAQGMELAYEEKTEHAQVVLRIKERNVQMQRVGEMNGTLHFVQGERRSGTYTTVYGEIPVAVQTNLVEITQKEAGGMLKLDYAVYVGGEHTSDAVIEVTWRF